MSPSTGARASSSNGASLEGGLVVLLAKPGLTGQRRSYRSQTFASDARQAGVGRNRDGVDAVVAEAALLARRQRDAAG